MFRLFSTSDAQLVRQTLAGRRDAFGTLVERYRPVAYVVAYARVHTHTDAEDVAQESLLAAYQRLDTLRDPARFGAWLAGIARHCASRVRERRLRDATVAERHNGEEPVVMPDHERRELWELIRAEIDRLNEPDREVVLLHYFAGKSSREIASVTDATSGAVRKRLQRARETLGSRLLEQVAEPAQPDREKTQHIMGLIAASPAAWEKAGLGPGAIPLTGGITMSKVVGFVFVVAALIGGVYVVKHRAINPAESENQVRIAVPQQSDSQSARSQSHDPITLAADIAKVVQRDPGVDTRPVYHIELQGIVFGADNEPMADVPVNIQLFEQARGMNGLKKTETPLATQTISTDENGYVQADFGMIPDTGDRLIAEWRISRAGMYCYSRTGTYPITSRNLIPMFMRSTQSLHGTVRDGNGNPIAGARVRPIRYEGTNINSRYVPMPDDAAAVTGADGTFSFNQLYAGRWKFLVQADGHGATSTDFMETGTTADVKLPAALTLAGTAVDEVTDDPIAGLELVLQRETEWSDTYRVQTDAAGRYAITSLTKGTYWFWSSDKERFVREPILTVEKSRENYTIEMAPGVVMTGCVLDADTHTPIPGVRAFTGSINLDHPNTHPGWYARSKPTGVDGVYRITGLPDGEYQIGFSGPTQLPPATETGRSLLPVGKVRAGQVYDGLDYFVVRRYPVSGVVRDTMGQPLQGVNIVAYSLDESDESTISQGSARLVRSPQYSGGCTDAQGRFQFWLPGVTERLVLVGVSGQWATHEYGPVPVKAGGLGGIDLTAYLAGRIFGIVKSPDGALVPSAPVAVDATHATAMRDVPENDRWAFGAGQVWARDGRFSLVGLPPDDYTFTYGGASRTVSLGPGDVVDDVVLQAMPEGSATIEGTTYIAGHAAAGVSVTFSNDTGNVLPTAVSNEDGVYRVAGIPGGSLRYSANTHIFDRGMEITRYLHGSVEVPTQGVSTFDISLAQGTSAIEGVVTENGEPKRRAQFSVGMQWDETISESVTVMTDKAGFYRLSGLPAGDHELVLDLKPSMPNDGPHSYQYFYTVSTADGQTTRHDIHLDMGSVAVTFSGIGAGEQGRVVLVPNVVDAEELTLSKASSLMDHAVYETEIEKDGSVTIDDVPAGTHTVLFAVYDANATTDEEQFASTRYTYRIVDVVQNKESALSISLPK